MRLSSHISYRWVVLLLLLTAGTARAEKRYYFVRGGELPAADNLTSIDLRAGHNGVTYNAGKNATLDTDTYAYPVFRITGGWFVTEHNLTQDIDMSDITNPAEWYLVIKMATNEPRSGRIRLNNQPAFPLQELSPAFTHDSLWHTYTLPLPVSVSYNAQGPASKTDFFSIHFDNATPSNFFAIDFAYLTNDITNLDPGTATADKACQENLSSETATPTRFYYTRAGELPQSDRFRTVDLRPCSGNATIVYNRANPDANAPFLHLAKVGEQWLSFDQRLTGNSIDMSMVNADNWHFVLKVATSVALTANHLCVRLNNDNSYYLSADDLPADGTWQTFIFPLAQAANHPVFTKHGPSTDTFWQLLIGGGCKEYEDFLAIDVAYLTNDLTDIDNGTADCPQAPLRIYHHNDSDPALPVKHSGGLIQTPIAYLRKFQPGIWESLYLPFEVERITVYDSDDATHYDLVARTATDNTIADGNYWLRTFSNSTTDALHFHNNWVNSSTPLPQQGIPYIIMFPDAGNYYNDKYITFHAPAGQTVETSYALPQAPVAPLFGFFGNTTLLPQQLPAAYFLQADGYYYALQEPTLYPFESFVLAGQATMQRMPRLSLTDNDNTTPTVLANPTSTHDYILTCTNRQLLLQSLCNQTITVFTFTGDRCFCKDMHIAETCTLTLPAGYYILHSATQCHKIYIPAP